jgi:asparagine synthase (glutamine-hydrolysing)
MALGGPAVRAWRAVRGGIPGLPAQGWFSDRAGTPGPGQRPSGGRPLRRRLIETLLGRPLQQVLRFTDRNAMATSIENRVPFLHRGVIELAWSFPADHLVGPEGVHKIVLREAVRHHVPAEIIERRDQMGFITPTVVWLRALAPWARTLLDPLRAEPWIRRDVLDLSWRHATEEGKPEAAQRIWLLLSLAQWRETYDVEFT